MRRILAALVVLIATAPSPAQDTVSLIGHRVVLKYKSPLAIGGVSFEPKDYRAYTVEKAEGDDLWVVSGGVSGWVRRGQVMTLDEALRFYTEEVARNPSAWNAYLYRGFVWDVRHAYEKAIDDYSAAIRIYPLWANTFNNRGWTWHKLREFDKAISDYDQAIKLDPRNVLAFVNRGLARQEKGEYYKAINDFHRAIRIDPKYARAHTSLAWLYATCADKKFRDGKLALESATRACDLSKWKDAGMLSVLAAAHAEAGDFEKAVRWQQQAIDRYVDPEDRKQAEVRLDLFKKGKPFRVVVDPGRDNHHGDHDPFARFHDPILAARVYAELEHKIGDLPDGAGDRDRHERDKKIAAAILQVARRHHMRQRDVKAIWNAGIGDDSSSEVQTEEKSPD